MRILKRIVFLKEGPGGPRRTIKREWHSPAHVKWAGKYDGMVLRKYRAKAIYGTNRVCARGFEERNVRR